jgi:threonine dehydratase
LPAGSPARRRPSSCRDVVQRKRQALERFGAEVILARGDYAVAEREGRALAADRNAMFVSPYNDPQVVAGQGTLGVELAGQWSSLGKGGRPEVFVPVSGGGLLVGVGLGLKLKGVAARLVGVQTASAPYFHSFFHGGDPAEIVERPTIADGLAGAVEQDSITWDLVRHVADDIVLVSEEDAAAAMRDLLRATGILVEPSAAVSVAAARASKTDGLRIALLSGGNVDPSLLERLQSG